MLCSGTQNLMIDRSRLFNLLRFYHPRNSSFDWYFSFVVVFLVKNFFFGKLRALTHTKPWINLLFSLFPANTNTRKIVHAPTTRKPTQYELRLAASDNLKENYTTVVIHVKDVNDNPPVFERPTYRTQITEEDDRNLPKRVLQVLSGEEKSLPFFCFAWRVLNLFLLASCVLTPIPNVFFLTFPFLIFLPNIPLEKKNYLQSESDQICEPWFPRISMLLWAFEQAWNGTGSERFEFSDHDGVGKSSK